jgi:hypothetical protein
MNLLQLYEYLLKESKDIEPEFEEVLNDNIEDLYL